MKHLRIKINKYEVNWKTILKDINFVLNENDRVSLVWWNWVWKSTLFKIITKEITDFDWNIENIWNINIWYLSQIFNDKKEKTVYDEIKNWFKEIIKYEKILKDIEEKMIYNTSDDLIEKYNEVLEIFNNIWGYNYDNIIHQVANWIWIFNLLTKKLWEISWWERTKVALAKILIEKPDMLFLDEPTNFIDMKSVEWLESYLQNKWPNWYFIISHDREFLDKTCNKTYELQPARPIIFYNWNYSFYVNERKKIEEIKLKDFERQQDFIKKEENLINRFRAWSRASFAQSRQKALEKLEKIEKPYIPPTPKFFFDYIDSESEKILYFKECFIGRNEPLFFINEISLNKKQRIWIIWENWVWKSTLLKTIMWYIKPLDWIFTKWKWLKIAYYSQLHEELDKEKTIRENFLKNNIFLTDEQLIGYLKHYLIEKEMIDKPVKLLSWWERSKLLFAILWQKESNLLILDEPTNHLDYDSKESLEKSLKEYPWSILFISHDRYFINKISDMMWIIKDNELSVSYWNYEDYLYKKEHWIDMNINLVDLSLEMDLVLEEKLWQKEAKRLKEKFWKKRK